MGFMVSGFGLRFGVQGLGLGIWDSVGRVWVCGLGFGSFSGFRELGEVDH